MARRFQQPYSKNPVYQNKLQPIFVENVRNNKQMQQQQRFFIVIHNCPKSLKMMVQFYRILGYSFAGITFSNEKDPKGSQRIRRRGTNTSATNFNLTGFLLILFNLFVCVFKFYGPYFLLKTDHGGGEPVRKATPNGTTTTPSEAMEGQTVMSYFSMQQYDAEFADLKPILRVIMQSVMFIYLSEMTIVYLHCGLLSGGRLLAALVAVPPVRGFDGHDNDLLARRLFRYLFALLTAVYLVGVATFSREKIVLVVAWAFGYQPQLPLETRLIVLKLFIVGAVHYVNDLISSLTPMLFLYTMMLFRRHVQVLRETIKKVELDEVALVKVKGRLSALSEHFSTVMGHFALSITVVLVSITFLLVSSSCYLMINQGQSSGSVGNQLIGYIFVYALVSFIRLLIICSSGSLVTTAYRDLVRTCYEAVPEWDLATWMAFNEVRRLKGKFRVVFYSTYAVKQSAILAVLGFVLSYVVILLQTESYSGGSSSAGGGGTDLLHQNSSTV